MVWHKWVGDPAALLTSQSLPQSPVLLMASPFAEEQARCRRLQYLATKSLAESGHALVWLDLPGTGDSPMPEDSITTTVWMQALSAARDELARLGHMLVGVGGLRLGATVAGLWQRDAAPGLPLWPVEPLGGQMALRALLRSEAVRQSSGGQTITADALLKQLSDGSCLHAAGYPLSASLLDCLLTLDRVPLPAPAIRLTGSGTPSWLRLALSPAREEVDALADALRPAFGAAA